MKVQLERKDLGTDKQLEALTSLLIEKGIITEEELAAKQQAIVDDVNAKIGENPAFDLFNSFFEGMSNLK